MSKAERLQELPKLKPDERREVLERPWDLEDQGLLNGLGPLCETFLIRERSFCVVRGCDERRGVGTLFFEVETPQARTKEQSTRDEAAFVVPPGSDHVSLDLRRQFHLTGPRIDDRGGPEPREGRKCQRIC